MKNTIRAARARIRRWHSPLYTYSRPYAVSGPTPVCRAAATSTTSRSGIPMMGERT